ncbi:MAG: GspH/FimT family pseudopilin [Gammaproteobacteria bacterium]|nr:GspH/FimT family pseudopilin [Gammaproteobacteria bacterium]
MAAGKQRSGGWTLVESLIVVALIALLAGVALPGLGDLLAGSRIKATASRFMTHVNLARTKAILRSQRVVVCPSSDGLTCLGDGDWHRGWLVFEDRDGDREHAPGEPLLQVSGSRDGIRLETSHMRRRLVFQPTGLSPASNGTYTVCGERAGAQPLAVIVSNAGRARLSRVRPDGTPLVCG